MIEEHLTAPIPLEETVPADLFKTEVRVWVRRIGVEPREIHIRPMSRKWASCSSLGGAYLQYRASEGACIVP